jgi:hypothetical protein
VFVVRFATLGGVRRSAGDGEVLRVLGICVVVFGTLSAALLDHLSHLHVCLQPWRVVLFDWVHFNGRTYPCLAWWTRGRSVLVSLDAVFLGALLLMQGYRARADEAWEVGGEEDAHPAAPVGGPGGLQA